MKLHADTPHQLAITSLGEATRTETGTSEMDGEAVLHVYTESTKDLRAALAKAELPGAVFMVGGGGRAGGV